MSAGGETVRTDSKYLIPCSRGTRARIIVAVLIGTVVFGYASTCVSAVGDWRSRVDFASGAWWCGDKHRPKHASRSHRDSGGDHGRHQGRTVTSPRSDQTHIFRWDSHADYQWPKKLTVVTKPRRIIASVAHMRRISRARQKLARTIVKMIIQISSPGLIPCITVSSSWPLLLSSIPSWLNLRGPFLAHGWWWDGAVLVEDWWSTRP